MALIFRSSSPETKVFIDREFDGRQRVAVATRESGARQWQLRVEHPDGQKWHGTFNGDKAELPLAMAKMLADRENEFIQARARGDRPPSAPFDPNRPVDESGQYLAPPIRRFS